MRRRSQAALTRLAGALLVCAVLFLPQVAPAVHADAADDAVRRVAVQLQCPICQGETVWDSQSGLAQDMRSVIRQKQAAGESDKQILQDFVAAYGDGILTTPPKQGVGLAVWVLPLAALAVGVVLLGLLLRTWRRPARAPRTVETPEIDDVVAEELTRFRRELA